MQPMYAPQPQQYGPPPQGYAPQQAPQQYAPPQPQYAPPQAPPAPGYGGAHPQGVSPVHAPTPSQSNIVRPRLLDFARDNRLVLIHPMKIERGVPNNLGKPGEVQDRMTADVVIFDGPAFAFGGAPERGKPHTHMTTEMPYEILSMWITPSGLISQCERRVGEYIAGRLSVKNLPNGNTTYKLDDPTQAEIDQTVQYLVAKAAGQVAPPQQIPAQQPYAPPAAPAPQQAYMTAPAPLPPYAGAQPAYGPPQPQYAPPAPPQAPQLDITTPPVGWTSEQWLAQPEASRVAWAQQALQSPGV